MEDLLQELESQSDVVVIDCAEALGQVTRDWTSGDLAGFDLARALAALGRGHETGWFLCQTRIMLVQERDELTDRRRFRIDTAYASGVIIDAIIRNPTASMPRCATPPC